ncbi:hypothetical protein [uncultured Formosa sp.]|uniref:hypothetical protein n=1 Tax=uncultured Formosa sp. TaxID=255435 RepID=UPI00261654C0|nr:hypothetical protein [uncultured Formosa sp.]
MKKIIYLSIITLILYSCSESDDSISTSVITGNWQWQSASGGLTGSTETPESTGENRMLIITADSIASYQNEVLNFKTAYTIENRTSELFNDTREMLIQENGFKQIITITNNTLVLVGDCFDCYSNTYISE